MTIFSEIGRYRAPDAKDLALHQQLYRYAEDMQLLMNDHKSLEERHRVLQNAFDRTSNTFRALDRLLNNGHDLYLVTDHSGRVRHCNPACGVLCSIEALIEMNLLDFANSESRQKMQSRMKSAALSDEQKSNLTSLCKKVIASSSREAWVLNIQKCMANLDEIEKLQPMQSVLDTADEFLLDEYSASILHHSTVK